MEKEGKIDCLNYDLIDGAYISYDGMTPQGTHFLTRIYDEADTNNPLFFPEWGNAPILGEEPVDSEENHSDPEESFDNDGCNSETDPPNGECGYGFYDDSVRIDTLGPSDPRQLLKSLYFPSGFIIERYIDRKGEMHHWHMTLAPNVDRESRKIFEKHIQDAIEDESDEPKSEIGQRYGYDNQKNLVIDDIIELWPRVRYCSEEGATFSIGQMLEIIIDNQDDVCVKSLNYDPENDEECEDVHLGPVESLIVNGSWYKRYEIDISLEQVVPVIEVDEGDPAEDFVVLAGFLVRDCGGELDDEFEKLRAKIESRTISSEDIQEVIIPYLRVCHVDDLDKLPA